MESGRPPSMGKRLWHIVRVLFFMIRKGISKEKLMMDLHHLLKRGKIAGKALGNLMTFHHHHHHRTTSSAATSSVGGYSSTFSCRSINPDMSFYNPREVEFSCSNTPSFPPFHAATKRNKSRHHHHDDPYKFDAAAIAKAFEILNSEISDAESVVASPSPAPPVWSYGKSPMMVRPLRITDSPFPIIEEEGEVDRRVDTEAEEFIRRFYEQLRLQHLVPATPDYRYRRGPLVGQA